MNRLILVGNGFDLAHGLKTSYCHFITDYLFTAVNIFLQRGIYEDNLLEIKFKNPNRFYYPDPGRKIVEENVFSYIEQIKIDSLCIFNIKAKILDRTINKVQILNWVDIENEYFEELLKCKRYQTNERIPKSFNLENVNKLNDEFEFLKQKFEEYLIKHEKENTSKINPEYVKLFCSIVNDKEYVIPADYEKPKRILIVSFNYTGNIGNYVQKCSAQGIKTEIVYIHGVLNTLSNPIIFGFGDEYNKNYIEFEDFKNKELLQHIKSFGYFKTSNYHNLLRFLELDGGFETFTFGHSLGLSDRTMLKEIFEHQNCLSIKIFYHQKDQYLNDYIDKTYDINSHFTNKGLMRRKIVPFDKSQPMPQFNN